MIDAIDRAIGELEAAQGIEPRDVQLAPSREASHGDFASNAALVLAKRLGLAPRVLAERIASALEDPEGILDKVEVAGPGFINFSLAPQRWQEVVADVLRLGCRFGHSAAPHPERIMIEFVSANPTGPLHIGHGRNGVVGDALARLLEATGHSVVREYYFNDAGRQMRVLGASLRARYLQALGREEALPEEGYRGEYLVEIAQRIASEEGEALLDAAPQVFEQRAREAIFRNIRATLSRLGIVFDVYYNENSIYEAGAVERTLEDLRALDLVYEADGAVWFKSRSLGYERDRVLVKSSGEPTYLLPDVAYHREKFKRGFDRLIDVLGPDHIEQVPYVREAVSRLGCDGEKLEVVYYQWVNLRRRGERVGMSTRAASFVSVDELLDEVGPDVFRYFMLERRTDTHFDFDVDLASDRSERNPVYKIQYAHARMCSIERKGLEAGIDPLHAPLDRLELATEIELAKQLGRWPEVVVHAAREREPQQIARYLLDLATGFHSYISDGRAHRVLSEDRELSQARLALVRSVRTTLGNGLELLGISAPERM
ncbi:MAG: arginine--tRNA ligase [Myxococcota bacterium]